MKSSDKRNAMRKRVVCNRFYRKVLKAVRPDVVDISSGVEYDDISVKGKDENKVKTFIQNAKY